MLLWAAGGGTSAAQASSVAAAIQEAVVGGGSGTLVEVRSRDAAEIEVRGGSAEVCGRLAGFTGNALQAGGHGGVADGPLSQHALTRPLPSSVPVPRT